MDSHFSTMGHNHSSKTGAEADLVTSMEKDVKDDSSLSLPPSPRLDLAQRLDRFITFIPAFAFVSNLQASWESVAVSFQAGLINGGPTSLVYGQILAWIGSMAIVLSLAEMASINPTVGAQYRWTGLYAPPGLLSPAFWGLLQGWITVFAWIATTAQPAFLLGTQIQGLLIMFDSTYGYERWHGTLLALAVLCIPLFFNIFARRTLPAIEYIGAFTHIGFFFIFVIVLVALAPVKSSASFVFTQTITGLSGWSSPGIQWNIGLLSAVFPLAGFDAILHMSDEVKDAPRKVPHSMILSVLVNGFMAFTFMITILFTIGDPEAALSTPTGYPIIEILYTVTNSKAGTAIMITMLMWNGLVAMFSALASVSRLTWAFARDHGLPFPGFFGKVNVKLRVPLNSLMLVSFIVGALQLINIGSTTALFAILSLGTIALYLSYTLPILFIMLHKLRGQRIPYGPFKLGKFGLPINLFAFIYGVYILIWLPFPPYLPVSAANMNYGGPVMAGVIVFALIDWVVWGRKRFSVPVEIEHVEW